MNPVPEYLKHVRVDYQDQATREAFSNAKTLAALQGAVDWLAPMEKAIFRANLRDVDEHNTSVCKIGEIFMTLELKLVQRNVTASATTNLIRIDRHYIPTNQHGARVALADQRASWFSAFDGLTDTDEERVRKAALHRVRGRLFHPVARQALFCAKPAGPVAEDWIAMIHRYAERIVDEGHDETKAMAAMKRLISRRQINASKAA